MLIHRPYFAGRESRGRGNRHAADGIAAHDDLFCRRDDERQRRRSDEALIKALTAPSAAPIYKARGLDPHGRGSVMHTRAIGAVLLVITGPAVQRSGCVQQEAVTARLTVQACMDAHESATLRRDSTVGLFVRCCSRAGKPEITRARIDH
jgi:hypothetical protein